MYASIFSFFYQEGGGGETGQGSVVESSVPNNAKTKSTPLEMGPEKQRVKCVGIW